MSVLICVFVVLTVAAMVRIAAGFGFALVAVPPLALLLDPVSAVVVAATLAVPLNLWVMARDRAHVDRRGASLLVVCTLAGVPFGLWALNVLSESTLLTLIAASVGAFLGAKTAVWFEPAREGEAYIAALPGSIPADCVWNLSFD